MVGHAAKREAVAHLRAVMSLSKRLVAGLAIGGLRDELLNETLFLSLDHARKVIAAWADDYNTTRPHSALAYQTPAVIAAKLTATGLHAALSDGSAFRPVAQPARKGIEKPETLKATG